MAEEGARLVLSARNAGRLEELAAGLRDARAVAFDVTDPAGCATAAAAAGPVDGVVYCVGLYAPMTARTWNPDEACAIAEANFIGALRLLGHVVPAMIARGRGRVLLIGSLAGHRGLPGAIGYGASKAAIMHLGENLHADLHGTGVKVQVVNPGFIETRLTARNSFAMPQIMPPEAAAAHVMHAIAGGRFSTSFPAPFAWFFLLGRWLPLGLFHALLRRSSR